MKKFVKAVNLLNGIGVQSVMEKIQDFVIVHYILKINSIMHLVIVRTVLLTRLLHQTLIRRRIRAGDARR